MAGPELVVLARHALPTVDPSVPLEEWTLTPEGVDGARRMAERLRTSGIGITRVISSVEAKAVETGQIVADHVGDGVAFQTGHDLHEHERREFVEDRATLDDLVEQFFARPTERVYGASSASASERRFSAAIDALVAVHKGERLCFVAHGLVLCLHLAGRYDLDAYKTHRRLGLPAYVVVDRRTGTVVDLVDSV